MTTQDIAIVVAIVGSIFVALGIYDYVGSAVETATGVVRGSSYVPAHTTTTLVPIQSGDTTIFMPLDDHHPAYYRVEVEVEGEIAELHLTNNPSKGTTFVLSRRRGCISGTTSSWRLDE